MTTTIHKASKFTRPNTKKVKRSRPKSNSKSNKSQSNRQKASNKPPTKRIRTKSNSRKTKRQTLINKLRAKETLELLTFHYVCVIWGHGALVNDPKNPFTNNEQGVHLNVWGLGISGCVAWTNLHVYNYIDKTLASGHVLNDKILTGLNNAIVSNNVIVSRVAMDTQRTLPDYTSAISKVGTNTNLYTTVFDFGRNGKRSNKIFTREENTNLAVIPYPIEMREKIIKGPVLRIYKVAITPNNKKMSDPEAIHNNTYFDIGLPDYSTYHNIIHEIYKYTRERALELRTLSDTNIHRNYVIPEVFNIHIDIDIFDTTCNYTTEAPKIAYLENEKVRQQARRGEIKTFHHRRGGRKGRRMA